MPEVVQTPHEAALQTLFAVLQPLSLAPLWTQYRAMLTPTPQGKARPYLWRYTEIRPHLLRAYLGLSRAHQWLTDRGCSTLCLHGCASDPGTRAVP